MSALPPLTARWIWKSQPSYNPYQQTIFARRAFRVGAVERGVLRISADGQYRLAMNGEWVSDGPCRSWPEHFQYDQLDLTPYLVEGENELLVIARHWSAGTFHSVPRQAGLLAQLDLWLADGSTRRIASGRSWQVAEALAWQPDAPKVSIQMEPQELYDARLEDALLFEPAAVLYPAGRGPWQDLHPRDVALLTRKPLPPRSFLGANLVRRNRDIVWCVPTARLANPGLIEANRSVSNAGGMCAWLGLDRPAELRFVTDAFQLAVDGVAEPSGRYALAAGEHFVLALSSPLFGHDKDRSLRLLDPPDGLRLSNPLDPGAANPWCWIDLPAFSYHESDLVWPSISGLDGARERLEANYEREVSRLLAEVSGAASFAEQLAPLARALPAEEMFQRDPHWAFISRQPLGDARPWVENPAGSMQDNLELTTIHPAPEGDIELVYDLGEQSVGYYDLDLLAGEGVEVDLFSVEHITTRGEIQHTWGNRNGMRYITRAGANRFTSLKRRAGRYLYVTLRNLRQPLHIRKLQLVESTYPVDQQGWFDCSDSRLSRIWEISARTLKLCMEDTFTDCPLYEQTLWVGDARNEAVFAFDVFGAHDLARRCLRLTAQSLERYPIAGCQVPSSWDTLLPAWSFLWGIAVWDYYQASADLGFLAELWPAVLRNLQGASGLLDERGLFSGPFWNMFDWSGSDDGHNTVLHNSLLLVGAIGAALKCAGVLGETAHVGWLEEFRERLAAAANRLWDAQRAVYPDSVRNDGTLSPSASLHGLFLALLYDVLPPSEAPAALEKLLHPPADLVQVGSPFAMMYYYETLEKYDQQQAIMSSIYANYLPMLEAGATTVWEVFPTSRDRPADFPTRSHCHAWSSAPLHFLPRILLGVRPLEAGRTLVEVSPRPSGLSWARGALATPLGPVEVSWRREGDRLTLQARAPQGVTLRFQPNAELEGLLIERNF